MDNALTDFKKNFDQWETQDLEVKAEKSCKTQMSPKLPKKIQ